MPPATLAAEPPAAVARGRLSARLVGDLSAAEQFVVWALRQRAHDAAPASPVLVHGFRLAFGLAALEPAMAAFEAGFAEIAACSAAGGLALCPLRCACLTADEEAVLGRVAAAQLAEADGFARCLVRAGLVLGPARLH